MAFSTFPSPVTDAASRIEVAGGAHGRSATLDRASQGRHGHELRVRSPVRILRTVERRSRVHRRAPDSSSAPTAPRRSSIPSSRRTPARRAFTAAQSSSSISRSRARCANKWASHSRWNAKLASDQRSSSDLSMTPPQMARASASDRGAAKRQTSAATPIPTHAPATTSLR